MIMYISALSVSLSNKHCAVISVIVIADIVTLINVASAIPCIHVHVMIVFTANGLKPLVSIVDVARFVYSSNDVILLNE